MNKEANAQYNEFSHFVGYGDIQRNTKKHNVKQSVNKSYVGHFIVISLAFIAYVAYDIITRG